LAYLKEKNVAVRHGERFNELPGKGSVIFFDTTQYSAGNIHYLVSLDVRFTEEEKKIIQDYADRGFSTMLLARGDMLIGLFACTDEIRHGVAAAIQKIRSLGVSQVIMLTGDNKNAAERIAKEVGVTEFHAGLSPQEKTEFVAAYKKSNPEGTMIMVGDGVNDAATLASADVGIAMGAIGSDAAIEAADVALMHDKFDEIGEMILLGRYTRRIARQDFIIWGVTNVVGLFLVFTHVIGPTGAAVFNFATDFFPLLNSTRLFALHKKIDSVRK
jgi:Cd2+/Zn2+-exporting ATPase